MTVVITHTTPADGTFSAAGAAAWNADHALSGVGTLAEQDASAVAITGGTIDGTTVGGTTPAAATFTTLTATGQTSLGGATGSESIRVVVPGSAGNYWQFSGSSGDLRADYFGGSLNIGAAFVARGSGNHNFSTGTSATNIQLRVAHTASAVNYVQVTGGATSLFPTISAQGSDSAIGISYVSKGAARHNFFTGGGTSDRQLSIVPIGSAVNYAQIQGASAGTFPAFSVQGTDTNISQVFQTKGTGAIDLAVGSQGVNISNGGTVTAITGTAGGSYTTVPTITISAPTTAGGVQATGTAAMAQLTSAIAGGGTGYTVGDVLTFVGGTFTAPITVTVSTVSAGVITGFTVSSGGTYTVLLTNPVSVTGGTGSGATFNVTAWQVRLTAFTITNAGSGYVEQPTVTFSSGTAAAYASVGAGTTVRSIGATMDFYSPNANIGMRVYDAGGTGTGYWRFAAGFANTATMITSSAGGNIATSGTGALNLQTNSTTTQVAISHTASAVNSVQLTGSTTGLGATISSQGSDTNVGLNLSPKGGGTVALARQRTNYWQFTGSDASGSPSASMQGTDANIDLTLTPKGTGNVRFGTYTANMALTIQGYIEIKDAGGTVRRLAVVA